ncbi:DNA polymerase III subunit beta [Streptomyces shaanxiensis]
MKLVIDTDHLADAAQWAMRAVPSAPPTAVLACLRLEAADGTLTVTGYDYYRSARASEDCEVSDPGVALVPGRVLTDLVRAFPKTKQILLALDGNDLTVSCGSAHITLPTLPLADYPALPKLAAPSGTVDGPALAAAATRVAAAASTDDTLPVLTTVQFTLSEDTMTLASTDRYRFHNANLPWTPNPNIKGRGKTKPRTAGSALVPADVVADAARILADADTAEITITDGQFAVSVPGRWATGGIIEGALPKYAFPTEFESVVTTATEALADAIKHVTPLLDKTDPLVLDITGDHITVRAGTEEKGRGRDQVDASLEGEQVTVAFNPGLLLKTLQQIDGPVVQLNFNTATKPALMHVPEQADTFQGLLMPIRLNN